MLSKNQEKFVRSLHRKKSRDEHGLFIAEGPRVVGELLGSGWEVVSLYATAEWAAPVARNHERITNNELKRISLLEAPQQVLALARKPALPSLEEARPAGPLLVLDRIGDPGNLGTILRTADWFGMGGLVFLPGTVDPFNPKAVQASMGSLFRAKSLAGDDESPAKLKALGYTLFAADTDGEPAGLIEWPDKSAIVLGSEPGGISEELLRQADRRVAIPRAASSKAESLNVASAAAVLCYLCTSGKNSM
jgi:TrmH family RNA methyltransferase